MKRLENKVAVIYGNGAVGTTVAKSFAREGAQVYLAGRTLSKLEAVSQQILSLGGTIEIDQVDAMNEDSVERHMEDLIRKSGKVDISFNAIGLPQTGHQGTALLELSLKNFLHPIATYSQSHFITAKAAARQMVTQKYGDILLNTPSTSR